MIRYSDGTESLYLPYNADRAALITQIRGGVSFCGFEHPLPETLTVIEGDVYLGDYNHPLPKGLSEILGIIDLNDYKYPLPPGLKCAERNIVLGNYTYPLPPGMLSSNDSPISKGNFVLPRWILVAENDEDDHRIFAVHVNGNWRINVEGEDYSSRVVASCWANDPVRLALIENLLEQIRQSSLK